MAVLTDYIRYGNIFYANIALSATVNDGPALGTDSGWKSLAFNAIYANQNNIVTSLTPSASSISLVSGIYQATFQYPAALNSGGDRAMARRLFNSTTSQVIYRLPVYVYNNLTSVAATFTTRESLGFVLTQNSTINLQIANQSGNTAALKYGSGTDAADGVSIGYSLELYRFGNA